MNSKKITLSGWGRSSLSKVNAYRPEKQKDLIDIIQGESNGGVIPHGGGRSYGDMALNNNGHVILTERLNRIISFNESSGEIVCEPGVTFKDLMDVFLPLGYLPPVCPGTAYATIGGAVINDVHGKNQEKMGSFGDHISCLHLITPTGESKRLSPTENTDLFYATIGGLGLTGFVSTIAFKMAKTSSHVEVHEKRVSNIDDFFTHLLDCKDRYTFSAGWIDSTAKGRNLGRGILKTAEFTDTQRNTTKSNPQYNVPFNLPSFTLNPLTVSAFNKCYFNRVSPNGTTHIQPITKFLYPLDSILNWNRIYGRNGFFQFQCVIPHEFAFNGIKRLMEEISGRKSAAFLSVLKTMGKDGPGLLSFPTKGLTLALDFPNRKHTKKLFKYFEKIVLEHNGKVYLAKDAVLSPSSFKKMYPKYQTFCNILDKIDPNRKFQSDLSRRLMIRG